jgi:uncharacterized membrane protein
MVRPTAVSCYKLATNNEQLPMQYTALDALGLIFRWLHILAAMAAVGGPMFIRWALLPTADALPDAAHRSLNEGIRLRWASVVRIAIMFLLLSGVYNLMAFERASRTWGQAWHDGPARLYHVLLVIKLLLALGIFFLASVLTGRSPAMARFRENAKFWVTVNLALGILLVGVSSQMRMMHVGPTPPPTPIKQESASLLPAHPIEATAADTTNRSDD